MNTNQNEYRTNALGHLVPTESIKPIDLLRDDTVTRLISKAKEAQTVLRGFKSETLSDIAAFLDISAAQYNTKLGGKKGNLSLTSFDGKYKVLLAVSDSIFFDERIHIAKSLIDECIHAWTADSNHQIRALIDHAFQTDKEGKINTGRVFSLMRLKIDDKKWNKAMEALKDSIQLKGSSQYLRFYERVGNTDQYDQLSLDLAGL